MQIKITDQIVFIPPYISTTWEAIASLQMDKENLIICLKDGKEVAIPNLNPTVIEQIFSAHVAYLEKRELAKRPEPEMPTRQVEMEQLLSQPFVKLGLGALEGIGQALQHNPQHRNLPPITSEIAAKISQLAQAMNPDDLEALPDPEQGCMCLYCQISRILKSGAIPKEHLPDHPAIEDQEESVTEEDLRFEQWIVESIGDKVYLVTNKLDRNEQYRVWLGDTIGCTCGKPNCEHIVAVLRA